MKMKKDGQLLLLTGIILTTMMLIIGTLMVMNVNPNISMKKTNLAGNYSSFKDKFGYALSDNINSNNTTVIGNAVNKTILNFKNALAPQNIVFQASLLNITNTTYIYVNISFYIKDDFIKIEEDVIYVFSTIDFKFIRRS